MLFMDTWANNTKSRCTSLGSNGVFEEIVFFFFHLKQFGGANIQFSLNKCHWYI